MSWFACKTALLYFVICTSSTRLDELSLCYLLVHPEVTLLRYIYARHDNFMSTFEVIPLLCLSQ